MTAIKFFVAGEPAPKGSTKSFPYRCKDGRIGVSTTNANTRTAPWEMRIATEAQKAMAGRAPFEGPVYIEAGFWLTRPKSLPKRVTLPIGRKNDLDKLLRCCLDGLTGICYLDDGQVAIISGSYKCYANHDHPPGCAITVGEVL
ncbi:MAG TPA: RusA family crossover junction endodeoxyribonuclease [Methanomassiliicoccales archaeon]|nr:RusA family crossover junction endodeoxyribonuclease [Methanomassiliicoccales archaeon]